MRDLQTPFVWSGRDDKEDGELGKRVHHIVRHCHIDELKQTSADVCLLGFECDAGVKRNKGREGAKQAPNLIRKALANMAWHTSSQIVDLGNSRCDNEELEQSQQACAGIITKALKQAPVITLGGGHEVAWASFQGLAGAIDKQQPPVIGIINFDAHFDLRSFNSEEHPIAPSSGTPFYQVAEYCRKNNWPFHYACLGVSRPSNTASLFNRADKHNVWYVEDNDLTFQQAEKHSASLSRFMQQCDLIYLTIDLDVFPAATAPGVSAPAARGVSYEAIAPLLQQILEQNQKLVLADIAEYNPEFDIDNQTARLAARLCWDIANSLSDSTAINKLSGES